MPKEDVFINPIANPFMKENKLFQLYPFTFLSGLYETFHVFMPTEIHVLHKAFNMPWITTDENGQGGLNYGD